MAIVLVITGVAKGRAVLSLGFLAFQSDQELGLQKS